MSCPPRVTGTPQIRSATPHERRRTVPFKDITIMVLAVILIVGLGIAQHYAGNGAIQIPDWAKDVLKWAFYISAPSLVAMVPFLVYHYRKRARMIETWENKRKEVAEEAVGSIQAVDKGNKKEEEKGKD